MSKLQAPLLSSNFGHPIHHEDINGKLVSSPVLHDLPSWTPLKTSGEDDGPLTSASDPEVVKLSTGHVPNLAKKRQRRRSSPEAQVIVNDTETAQPTSKPSPSGAQAHKAKKARFDSVLITTKTPALCKRYSSQTKPGPVPLASSQPGTSLVDALTRTFTANKYTEFPTIRRSRPRSDRHADLPTATDVETSDDDQFQLDSHLSHTLLKRRLGQSSLVLSPNADASETNSEDITPLPQDIPPAERPIKKLKPIPYESNPDLIDAALGTVEAPVSWDAELNVLTRGETSPRPIASADDRMSVDGDDSPAPRSPRKGFVPPHTRVGRDEWHTPTGGTLQAAVLAPYLSRGAKFRERLEALFGKDTIVRTDRNARPRPVDHGLFMPLGDEPDREPSPSPSESTISITSVSGSVAEVDTSVIPSTRITSQSPSPDIPTADISMDQLPRNQVIEAGAVEKPTGERISDWIAALQRLVKGKVHIKETDLEALSIVLAEIESVKDNLGSVLTHSELRASIKQLSELHEIPFGDRNKLRQRAENIFQTWPSMTEPGAP